MRRLLSMLCKSALYGVPCSIQHAAYKTYMYFPGSIQQNASRPHQLWLPSRFRVLRGKTPPPPSPPTRTPRKWGGVLRKARITSTGWTRGEYRAPPLGCLIIYSLNPELYPICCLLALLGAHHFLHVSTIRIKLRNFRLLMSYVYGAPILDVSRSHTTTQHSR